MTVIKEPPGTVLGPEIIPMRAGVKDNNIHWRLQRLLASYNIMNGDSLICLLLNHSYLL